MSDRIYKYKPILLQITIIYFVTLICIHTDKGKLHHATFEISNKDPIIYIIVIFIAFFSDSTAYKNTIRAREIIFRGKNNDIKEQIRSEGNNI